MEDHHPQKRRKITQGMGDFVAATSGITVCIDFDSNLYAFEHLLEILAQRL